MIQKIMKDMDPSILAPKEDGEVSFLDFFARFGEVFWAGKVIRKAATDDNLFQLHNKNI